MKNDDPAPSSSSAADVAHAKASAVYDVTDALPEGEQNELVVRFWDYSDRGVGIEPARPVKSKIIRFPAVFFTGLPRSYHQ